MTSPSFVPELLDLRNVVTNTTSSSPAEFNATESGNTTCVHYDFLIETWFAFDTYQVIKVLLVWSLFSLSVIGNIFVLISLRSMSRLHHFIMFHLALADLVYACFVLPTDAIWNTTMQWYSGDALCKFAQMLKQFGMYSSSFMVVVIGVDRVTAIVYPTVVSQQRKLGIILVSVAWVASALCTVPAGVFFSIREVPTCEGIVVTQCVDNLLAPERLLQSYYFFTMFASFLLPFFATIISYSLIVCEISKMKERDINVMGRKNTVSSKSIQKAINRTIFMRTLITLTFLLCWGPYYAKGIADWFVRDIEKPEESGTVYRVSYLLMYFNCFLHPIVFGIFLREVRENFCYCFRYCCKRQKPERYLLNSTLRASVASRGTCITKNYNNGRTPSSNNNIILKWEYKRASISETKQTVMSELGV